jgi:hypothetical protein
VGFCPIHWMAPDNIFDPCCVSSPILDPATHER